MSMLHTIAGFLAIALFVFAYAMVNLGRWNERQLRFHVPNFIGSLCMIFSLIGAWNLPVFVLEICWGAIAAYGMWRAVK